MKKQSIIKILSAFVVALALGFATVGQVFAATPFVGDTSTLPIKRTVTTSINVTNTFTYAITANPGNPTGATDLPTTANIVFNNVAPTSGTAMQTGTVDFSGATFTTAGDYEFTISEIESTNPSVFPVDPTTYTIIVAVRYNTTSHALEATLVQAVKDAKGDKVNATWESTAKYTYFEIAETISGNMADVNKCFEYTLNIPAGDGVTTGDAFAANITSSCTDNPSSITAGTPSTIHLASGDVARVGLSGTTNQIPVGAGYTLTLVADDGYTATFNSESMTTGTAKIVTGLVATDDDSFNTKNKAALVLTKSQDIPTGIFTNVWTYVVVLGISATGVVVASKKFSKK